MNTSALVAAAATSLLATLATLAAAPATAQTKEKCYGISTAGQNDCSSLSGSHSCAGQSKTSKDANEWMYVAKGTCNSLKGLTVDQAKAKAVKG